jgi:hypothetical protein
LLSDEKNKLKGIDTKVIVDYIRTSIEILLNLKVDESNQISAGNYFSGNSQLSNIQKK